MNLHLKEIETLQNSLREREKHITELENRLRALWDKYDGDCKHYMERIQRLEEAGDRMRLFCADPDDCFAWDKAKEAKM
jgi:uncharacterized protein Yka (UPF0111/DUF47 family)